MISSIEIYHKDLNESLIGQYICISGIDCEDDYFEISGLVYDFDYFFDEELDHEYSEVIMILFSRTDNGSVRFHEVDLFALACASELKIELIPEFTVSRQTLDRLFKDSLS